jgi:diguanylate cyclase (GGDEF)-like protein
MTADTWSPPRWTRVLSALVPAVVLLYGLTLLPGVRGPEARFVGWLEIGVGDGTIAVSALLCLARAALVRRDRWAWALIGLGPMLYVGGDLFYYNFMAGASSPPYPSVSDALWLGLYPTFAAGLVLLVRSSLKGARGNLWLDGLTSGFGAAAILGAVVLRPVLEVTGGALPAVVTNLAYPVCDLSLLTVLILVFNLHGWRPGRVWWLLGLVAVTLLVVDSIYLLQVADGTYVDGGLLDVGWCVAFAGLGVAAWSRPADPTPARHSRAGLAVPAVLSILSTGVLFAGALQSLPFMVALFGLLTVLIASLRLTLSLLETWRLVLARLEARTDELTGLPNRRRFLELLDDSLRGPGPTSVMIVDLDRFKQVNDSLGHGVGDTFLTIIGDRLDSRVRTTDTAVARLGGDEFAVIVSGQDDEVVYTVAARIREMIQEPIELSGLVLTVDASVGIATAPGDGRTWESLLSRADAAMYVAKRTGTGIEFYTEQRDDTGLDRLALLAEFRNALVRQELSVYYQPVYDLADGGIVGAEALVRWPHPHLGLLVPADFLPAAIEAGLSRRLTDEVLRMVTEQAARWHAEGYDVPVAVNLTEADMTDSELLLRVSRACHRAGLPPELLHLEVTESITSSVVTRALPALVALREHGHALLLDDFGTGYSSLSFLRDLPLDAVKLDRSLLADLDRPVPSAIVRSTVELAHTLGLRIVAEGVETEAVLELVRGLGCDAVQGFLLHRPAEAEQVTSVLRAGRVPPATASAR